MKRDWARYRLPARMAAVLGGYLLYRALGDDRIIPGLMLGGGAMLVAWTVIDEVTLPRKERLSLMVVGSAVLGLGLVGLGLYLALR